mmetsp:Transcript_12922/g.41293  ORF Transcript_12922/g.41293 Transcript_12922/m.41293 type:complete len:360 (-) Transcript_12922:77-1156(-)
MRGREGSSRCGQCLNSTAPPWSSSPWSISHCTAAFRSDLSPIESTAVAAFSSEKPNASTSVRTVCDASASKCVTASPSPPEATCLPLPLPSPPGAEPAGGEARGAREEAPPEEEEAPGEAGEETSCPLAAAMGGLSLGEQQALSESEDEPPAPPPEEAEQAIAAPPKGRGGGAKPRKPKPLAKPPPKPPAPASDGGTADTQREEKENAPQRQARKSGGGPHDDTAHSSIASHGSAASPSLEPPPTVIFDPPTAAAADAGAGSPAAAAAAARPLSAREHLYRRPPPLHPTVRGWARWPHTFVGGGDARGEGEEMKRGPQPRRCLGSGLGIGRGFKQIARETQRERCLSRGEKSPHCESLE